MIFTFENINEFKSHIIHTLSKQYQNLYIGFHLKLSFKMVECVKAICNTFNVVGYIFLTFQVDSSAGFGESNIFTTQINIYHDECIGYSETEWPNETEWLSETEWFRESEFYSDLLSPIIRQIHDDLIEQFMITYDSDTRQMCANYFAETIQEELVATAFHPNRIERLIKNHGIEILDNM